MFAIKATLGLNFMQQLAQSQPSPTTITVATQSQLENEPGTDNNSDDGSPEWYVKMYFSI